MIGPMNDSEDVEMVCPDSAPEDADEVFPADAYDKCMPQYLTIGTQKAFDNDYAFTYEKKNIGSETIYVCNEGSKWARADEVLVLRFNGGTWTAWDSAVSADLSTLLCRQAVFRCLATDITLPTWHKWQINVAADPIESGYAVDWQGALWAETRVRRVLWLEDVWMYGC